MFQHKDINIIHILTPIIHIATIIQQKKDSVGLFVTRQSALLATEMKLHLEDVAIDQHHQRNKFALKNNTTINVSRKPCSTRKIPHMGDKESLYQCAQQHRYQKILLVRKNLLKNNFFSWQFYTHYEQKFSNLRPLPSITFSQEFKKSEKFGHWTSGSGGKRRLNGVNK